MKTLTKIRCKTADFIDAIITAVIRGVCRFFRAFYKIDCLIVNAAAEVVKAAIVVALGFVFVTAACVLWLYGIFAFFGLIFGGMNAPVELPGVIAMFVIVPAWVFLPIMAFCKWYEKHKFDTEEY